MSAIMNDRMAKDPISSPGRSAQRGNRRKTTRMRSVLVAIAIAAACAVLLELGTLAGSPLEDSYFPWEWSKKRLVFFFVCALAVVGACDALHVPARIASSVDAWRRGDGPDRSRALYALAIGAGSALACVILQAAAGILDVDVRWGQLLVIAAAVIASLLVLADIVRRAFEWGFLVLALGAGIAFCIFMPAAPAISWDGAIHYNISVAMSYVFDARYDAADQIASSDTSFAQANLADYWTPSSSSGEVWHMLLDYDNLKEAADFFDTVEGDTVAMSGTQCVDGDSYVAAAMLGHVPNAVGLWLGRLLQLPATGRFFLGRLVSLLVYVLVFFFAIRKLRYGKVIVGLIGLFPTSLMLAANYAYDPMCTSMLALAFSWFAGQMQQPDRQLTRADCLGIFIPFVLGALVKAVLFPLALVFLAMPRQKFRGRSQCVAYRSGVFACILVLLASFALPFLAGFLSQETMGDMRGGSEVNSGRQAALILADPLAYAAVIAKFTMGYLNPVDVVGLLPDYSSYLFPDWSRGAMLLGTACSLLLYASIIVSCMHTRRAIQPRVALAALLCGLAAYVLIVTALYVSFTAVASPTIAGVQIRYMLPLAAPMLLAWFACAPQAGHRPTPTFDYTATWIEALILLGAIAATFLI